MPFINITCKKSLKISKRQTKSVGELQLNLATGPDELSI